MHATAPVETNAKRSRRIWLAVPVLLVAALAAGAIRYGPDAVDRAQLGTDFGARVACSCHFVEGRPIDQCRADFEPGMTMVRLSVEEETETIIASVPMLASTRASHRPGWGCVPERWNN